MTVVSIGHARQVGVVTVHLPAFPTRLGSLPPVPGVRVLALCGKRTAAWRIAADPTSVTCRECNLDVIVRRVVREEIAAERIA